MTESTAGPDAFRAAVGKVIIRDGRAGHWRGL